MPRYTKTQKKRLAHDMFMKSRILFTEGLITAKEFETVQRLAVKVQNKLTRS
jgi:hypothetical protein